jgi:hypothetical protein
MHKVGITVYIILSLVTIGVLAVMLHKCRKTENFCGTCQGIGVKQCPNKELMHQLYNEGKLTEFTTNENPTAPWQTTTWDQFFKAEDSGEVA